MITDLNQCHKACFNCIKGYKNKHTLKTGQKFEVRCNGIPKDYIPSSILQSIKPKDRDMAKGLLDPVTWAANTLDWHCLDPDGSVWKRKNPDEYYAWLEQHPREDILGHSRYHRPYQATMLRCSSKRKVFRLGRQCLVRDSKILLSSGKTINISEITEGDSVISSIDNKLVPSLVTGHWNAGKKTIYEIKTKFGHSIRCTGDHRFLIANKDIDRYHGYTIDDIPHEWLSIETGLKKGSKLAVPLKTIHPEAVGNIPLARLLGYFIADGSCSTGQSAKFTNTNMDYLLEFQDLAKHFGSQVKWYEKGNGFDLIISNGRRGNNPLRNLLSDLGLTDITGPQKLIPDCIFNNNEDTTKEFIKTFWAADGYISTFRRTGRDSFRTEIGNLQENRKLVEQIQEILWRFGVHGYIKKEGNAFRYVISNKVSIENFLKNIGPIPGKEEACKKAIANLPNIAESFSNISEDLLWDYVSSIKEIGIEDTWDIEVEGSHNFIANGILTHNSGKTESLVISLLFNMFTKPGVPDTEGFKIVVITPYQTQIDLIFTRMIELINMSSITKNSIKRNIKAPTYTCELFNGSVVRGFTAGTKSGGNAEAVRGQAAHMLVFDEADYLGSGDMDAAMAIITNYPTATVWMSSTPSGKREMFFDNCNSKRYREFHYPSSVNPLWNTDLETDFKEALTELGYIHECFSHDTKILTEKGVKNIYEVETGDYVYDRNYNLVRVKHGAFPNGVRETFQYITAIDTIRCTPNHSFRGKNQEKTRIDQLSQIPVYPEIKRFQSKEEVYARLVGYNLGDRTSCSTRYQTNFYSNNKKDMDSLVRDIKTLYPSYSGKVVADKTKSNLLVDKDSLRFSVNVSVSITKDLLERGVIRGEKVKQEFNVPDFVLTGNSAVKQQFLAGLFGAEGSSLRLMKEGYQPGCIALSMYKSSDINGTLFFDSLMKLLLDIGIKSTFTTKVVSDNRHKYTLYVYNDNANMLTFLKKVGYVYAQDKEEKAFYWENYLKTWKFLLERKQDSFEEARKLHQVNKRITRQQIANRVQLSVSQVDHAIQGRIPKRLYGNELERYNLWLETHLENNILYLDILEVKKGCEEWVFNLTVDSEDHSYLLANGIETFNCEADFGEQEQGVFQNTYIQAAKEDYKYGDIAPDHSWTYAFGVDWNDTKIGTTINILGFHPHKQLFYIVDRHVVSREGWTQLLACQKIVELNRIWKPMAIYADKGFGGTQIEVLTAEGGKALIDPTRGPSHPDAALRHIIKAYDFGSTVEVRDLFTKQPIKKNAKGFLVESTVRRFESNDIRFSGYDEAMEDQLNNYVIDRVTPTGNPVYKANNETIGDHALDALMLSVVAFILEVTPLGKPKYSTQIAFTGGIGEKTEMEAHQGDLIFTSDRKKNVKDQRNKTKPVTRDMEQQTLFENPNQLPANHTNHNTPKLLAWEGFNRDAPRPQGRSLGQSGGRVGLSPRRGGRPTRKNI